MCLCLGTPPLLVQAVLFHSRPLLVQLSCCSICHLYSLLFLVTQATSAALQQENVLSTTRSRLSLHATALQNTPVLYSLPFPQVLAEMLLGGQLCTSLHFACPRPQQLSHLQDCSFLWLSCSMRALRHAPIVVAILCSCHRVRSR